MPRGRSLFSRFLENSVDRAVETEKVTNDGPVGKPGIDSIRLLDSNSMTTFELIQSIVANPPPCPLCGEKRKFGVRRIGSFGSLIEWACHGQLFRVAFNDVQITKTAIAQAMTVDVVKAIDNAQPIGQIMDSGSSMNELGQIQATATIQMAGPVDIRPGQLITFAGGSAPMIVQKVDSNGLVTAITVMGRALKDTGEAMKKQDDTLAGFADKLLSAQRAVKDREKNSDAQISGALSRFITRSESRMVTAMDGDRFFSTVTTNRNAQDALSRIGGTADMARDLEARIRQGVAGLRPVCAQCSRGIDRFDFGMTADDQSITNHPVCTFEAIFYCHGDRDMMLVEYDQAFVRGNSASFLAGAVNMIRGFRPFYRTRGGQCDARC